MDAGRLRGREFTPDGWAHFSKVVGGSGEHGRFPLSPRMGRTVKENAFHRGEARVNYVAQDRLQSKASPQVGGHRCLEKIAWASSEISAGAKSRVGDNDQTMHIWTDSDCFQIAFGCTVP